MPSLIQAMKDGDMEEVRRQLAQEVDIYSYQNYDTDPYSTKPQGIPIREAAYSANKAMLPLFLEHGANPNWQDGLGFTLLICAASSGQLSTVKLLLEAGANINAQEHVGRTALMWAVLMKHYDVAMLLMNNEKIDVTIKDVMSRNVLFYGATNARMLNILLNNEALKRTVNQQDNEGITVIASCSGFRDVVDSIELLLTAGADPTIRNRWGENALDVAKRQRQIQNIHLLEKHMAIESTPTPMPTPMPRPAQNNHRSRVPAYTTVFLGITAGLVLGLGLGLGTDASKAVTALSSISAAILTAALSDRYHNNEHIKATATSSSHSNLGCW